MSITAEKCQYNKWIFTAGVHKDNLFCCSTFLCVYTYTCVQKCIYIYIHVQNT